MGINSVNFKGSEASSFQDLIGKPQAYGANVVASTSVKGDEFKKSHKGAKAVGIIAVAAAAVAAALGLGAKHGVFTNEKITNETLKTIGGYLNTAGNFITDKAGNIWKSVKGLLVKGEEKAAEGLEKAGEAVADATSEVVEGVVS